MKSRNSLAIVAPLVVFAVACAVEKSKNPLSPQVAGPIEGVNITAPKALEPASGAVISGSQQPITLLIENSSTTGARPLNYTFEVATDAGFTNKVFAQTGIASGDAGRTSMRLPDPLGTGRSYYWRAQAQDGANTGPYSSATNFNVFTPVSFDKPTPISPANNDKVDTQTPDFKFGNAPRAGSPTSVGYVIEVATSDSFASKIAAWQVDEQASQTKLTSPAALPGNSQLFWHVRAFDVSTTGPWSDTAVFRTPAPVVTTPSPGTGTTPTPGAGGTCTGTQPIAIVQCRRAQFSGHMDSNQTLAFEKAVASDLNKSSIGGGPYGLLRKTNGASCGGYACDIICTGSGQSQKQWDILSDSDGAQNPTWGGPKTYPDIRADACDVF